MKWTVLLMGVAAVSAFSATYRDVEQEWNTFKLEHEHEEYQSSEEGSGVETSEIKDERPRELNGVSDHYLPNIQDMNDFHVDGNLSTTGSRNDLNPSYICYSKPNLTREIFVWKKSVTKVKNENKKQNSVCDSSWAFSAVGALEGQHFFKTGELRSLSTQNLIDCTHIRFGDKNVGCEHGGHPGWAFNYVAANGGINSAEDYPYEGLDRKCRYDTENVAANTQGFVRLPKGDEDCLKRMLVEVGPISVAIDDSLPSFDNYKKGVYYDRDCSTKSNRWVLLVGYGTEQPGGDYWVIKNSWGTSWGMGGYMKLARNRNNHCGIASHAIYPLF